MRRSRVAEGAKALGYEIAIVDSADEARQALRARSAALLVLDLQADDLLWEDVVAAAKEAGNGPVPVLAYGQHTKPVLLRDARRAGCDVVVPRSQLVEELPALIERARRQGKA
jgi:DNA-binding response OmpR family regulator